MADPGGGLMDNDTPCLQCVIAKDVAVMLVGRPGLLECMPKYAEEYKRDLAEAMEARCPAHKVE